MKFYLAFSTIICVLCSCNRELFVPSDKVVFYTDGYLLTDQFLVIFFPSSESYSKEEDLKKLLSKSSGISLTGYFDTHDWFLLSNSEYQFSAEVGIDSNNLCSTHSIQVTPASILSIGPLMYQSNKIHDSYNYQCAKLKYTYRNVDRKGIYKVQIK